MISFSSLSFGTGSSETSEQSSKNALAIERLEKTFSNNQS